MKNWFKNLEGKIRFDELLSKHTTFKIGGCAKFFIEPRNLDDIKLLLRIAKRYKIPFLVIGSGSNLLVSDKGINGMVVKLSAPFFKKIEFCNGLIEIGSGVSLSALINHSLSLNLSGCEFLAGIPGTVGGALVMNAGTKDKEIKDVVKDVTAIDYNGNIKTLHKRDIKFSYRKSNLSKYIVLGARIRLIKRDKEQIKDKIKEYLDYRKVTHDLSWPSAGCIFKNPSGYSAGRLIDLCDLKGERIGDAAISQRHANFILNLGEAKAKDVLKLLSLIRRKVKDKFNIDLKPEIKIWQN